MTRNLRNLDIQKLNSPYHSLLGYFSFIFWVSTNSDSSKFLLNLSKCISCWGLLLVNEILIKQHAAFQDLFAISVKDSPADNNCRHRWLYFSSYFIHIWYEWLLKVMFCYDTKVILEAVLEIYWLPHPKAFPTSPVWDDHLLPVS